MPDEPQPAPVETAEESETPSDGPKPSPKPVETVDFWKAKAREQEKRAKDNAVKAAEFDKFVEAQKTEAQKQAEAQAAIIARAEAAERDLAQLREAKELDDYKSTLTDGSGVPAKALRGGTREEIDDHFAILKALLPEPRKPGQVPAEGRTVSAGTGGGPAQEFAELIKNATRR